jgi:hypothetical protein
MRIAFALAAAALTLSSPALATGGLLCKPVGGTGPWLSLVIGHGYAPGIVCANLKEAGRWISVCQESDRLMIAQRWIDRERVWVDIIDRNNGRDEAKLRATVQPNQRIHTALGTLTRRGKTYKVRCAEG